MDHPYGPPAVRSDAGAHRPVADHPGLELAMRVRSLLVAVLCVLGGAGLTAAPADATPATAPAAATGTAYYVNCAGGNDTAAGTSPAAAWRSLAKVGATVFAPGDQILFQRGTACAGTLAPQGSGSAGSPITVDAYGTGASPLIAGGGAARAVLLRNQQWWEIRNLEITNKGPAAGNRRGVSVELTDFGTARHFVLENLDIHDVNGDDTKDLGGSGGIYFAVSGVTTQTAFDSVTIRNNTVRAVDREGVFFVSTWNRSGFEAHSAGVFVPWTGVVISGNRLADLGGDGIVPGNTTGALIDGNTVAGFQRRSAGYNAGIWAYDTDDAVFQHNEVSGGATTRDGMAYDVDQGSVGTVFQYNYSHDNAGGFFLLCNATGILRTAVIRYNISQNDSYRGFENCSGGIESADVYNNTVSIGPGISQSVIQENNTTRRNVRFRDNTVVKTGSGTASMTLRGGGYVLDHNDLVNVSGAPAGAGLSADPRLRAAGTATDRSHADGYQLCAGSPALNAGTAISGNGGLDYFGGPVAAGAPNIGAYAGAGVNCDGPIVSGAAYEIGRTGGAQAVDVPGSSTTPGTQLIQWTWHGGPNQRWTLTANADGSYTARNAGSGQCMDVNGGSTGAGAAVIQWTCTGNDNQHWRIAAAPGGGFTLASQHSGLLLTAAGTADGDALTQQPATGGDAQRWSLTPAAA
ncbi:RICIN domain-containing protein [Streptomyces sp. RKAG293]|uniref:RICIN domain-containing protein n=1 Tax=Streptomyces sp. RKAG293 TaxID=2893403 RepID=UPI002033D43F|nr:RICIN domain-containing protein [Streptomyces sp. RKAG293]MCM2423470.1 RICIN domain-containing protein [Streptomyces sp. RKAG293]